MQLNNFIGVTISVLRLVWFKLLRIYVLQTQQRIVSVNDFVRAFPHLEIEFAEERILSFAEIHSLSLITLDLILRFELVHKVFKALELCGGNIVRPILH